MAEKNMKELTRKIVAQALAFGADLAGVASVNDLKRSPSHRLGERLPDFDYRGAERVKDRKSGTVEWPQGARSAIVIAVAHPPDKPELDWLIVDDSTRNTPGNLLSMKVISRLAAWLENQHGLRCFKLSYHIIHGGIYMKDVAVLAGLGCIGKNNVLITPQYGPHQRLRVMLTDADLPTTGAIDFDACIDCPMPCRDACPQGAFTEKIYTEKEYGFDQLPGRNGVYSRLRCNRQMEIDNVTCEMIQIAGQAKPGGLVRYCRECELACPAGSS